MSSGFMPNNQYLEDIDPEVAASTLGRIVSSEGFAASPRLQRFLTYVVTETLAGRGEQILGKSIAVDVYEREIDSEAGVSLVRVEARRLRRLLAEYYEGAGSSEAIRFVIDPGGYKPRFEIAADPSEPEAPHLETVASAPRRVLLPVAVIAVVAAMTVAWFFPALRSDHLGSHATDLERVALREHSALSLQALNLAEQAQGMMFPVFDLERQRLAHGMFRHAISLDDRFHGGYAGASQTLVMLGLFNPDKSASTKQLREASELANKAIDLAPSNAWAIAAYAQSQAGLQKYPTAKKRAQLALDLAPNDGHVLDLVGAAAILANDPELAALASDPERPRTGSGRFGSRNIWGVSQMMLGNYENAIEAFSGAAAVGAPISAPSLLFQAVALDQLGEHEKAEALLLEMRSTWPGFNAAFVVDVIFHDGTSLKREISRFLESDYQ
jgi:tetratricopeptide (TPR) repeat protein